MTIDIDSLTVKQVREISSLAGCAKKKKVTRSYDGEPAVLVRAYSGVFFGYLISKTGASVELRNARQVWSWDSAGLPEKSNTVGDIAIRGVGSGSKISSPVDRSIIEQVGATFFASSQCISTFASQKWASK